MKQLFSIVLCLFSLHGFSTVWNVEVGGETGSKANPPYYSPQNLTILEGDQVVWTWVGGPFNVTCTGGAQFFSSGNLLPGQTFNFTFTVSGIYTYECTLENNNETMFGSIFVFPSGVNVVEDETSPVRIYPNPVTDALYMEYTEIPDMVHILDQTGRSVAGHVSPLMKQYNVSHFPPGVYFIQVHTAQGVIRRKFLKQ